MYFSSIGEMLAKFKQYLCRITHFADVQVQRKYEYDLRLAVSKEPFLFPFAAIEYYILNFYARVSRRKDREATFSHPNVDIRMRSGDNLAIPPKALCSAHSVASKIR